MRAAALLTFLLLCGCAIPYTPVTLLVNNAEQFGRDVTFCTQAAADWKPQPSLADIGEAAAEGGGSVISSGPVSWWIPALGAVSGGAQEAASQFNLNGVAKHNVARHCVYDTTAWDKSAIIAKPEN